MNENTIYNITSYNKDNECVDNSYQPIVPEIVELIEQISA